MTPEYTRIRMRFAKRGDLRFISHNDLMRCLERALRRAEIPMAQSQGFSPRPKIAIPLSLALGIEGRREVLELELDRPMPPEEVLARLAAEAPEGLSFDQAEALPPGRAGRISSASYEVAVPPERRERAEADVERFRASASWIYTRRRGDRAAEADLRPCVLSAELGGDGLLGFRLRVAPEGSARPEEFLEAVGLADLVRAGAPLARTDVRLDEGPASESSTTTPGALAPADLGGEERAPELPLPPPPDAASPDAD